MQFPHQNARFNMIMVIIIILLIMMMTVYPDEYNDDDDPPEMRILKTMISTQRPEQQYY